MSNPMVKRYTKQIQKDLVLLNSLKVECESPYIRRLLQWVINAVHERLEDINSVREEDEDEDE